MTPPTTNILYRVFQIRTPDTRCSAFTVEGAGDQQYLVTARHCVEAVQPGDRIELRHSRHDWVAFNFQPLAVEPPGVDIAVTRLPKSISPQLPVSLSTGGSAIGDAVAVLGFPLGLHTPSELTADGWAIPFVKSGTIAGTDKRSDGVVQWWIDVLGNPGFSGGPIVIPRAHQPPQVIAIVSAAQFDPSSGQNTGFVIGHPIDHVVAAIAAYEAS
jgi:S1-C subfamily serine protease